jgi:hypothetical protein
MRSHTQVNEFNWWVHLLDPHVSWLVELQNPSRGSKIVKNLLMRYTALCPPPVLKLESIAEYKMIQWWQLQQQQTISLARCRDSKCYFKILEFEEPHNHIINICPHDSLLNHQRPLASKVYDSISLSINNLTTVGASTVTATLTVGLSVHSVTSPNLVYSKKKKTRIIRKAFSLTKLMISSIHAVLPFLFVI